MYSMYNWYNYSCLTVLRNLGRVREILRETLREKHNFCLSNVHNEKKNQTSYLCAKQSSDPFACSTFIILTIIESKTIMPHFNIETSVKSSEIKDVAGALEGINRALSETMGVPFEYNVTTIKTDMNMIMGKPDEINQPCAQAWLWSIGRQGEEENKKHASKMASVIKEHLGVEPWRCYIFFMDKESYQVGSCNTTFKELLK